MDHSRVPYPLKGVVQTLLCNSCRVAGLPSFVPGCKVLEALNKVMHLHFLSPLVGILLLLYPSIPVPLVVFSPSVTRYVGKGLEC